MTHSSHFGKPGLSAVDVSAFNARRGLIDFPRDADDDDFRAHGWWPMTGTPPAYNPATQLLTGPAYEADTENETVERVWAVQNIPLITVKRRRATEVDTLRDERISLGCEADINGDETLVIPLDMRNSTDLTNIHGFVTNAIAAARANVTDPVLKFRGADNVTHNLTPEQGIRLGEIAARYYTNCYERAWALKDQIASAGTVAAVMAIDIITGWPNQ